MGKINYANLKEITVKTQEELDAIPDDFKGQIYIESNSVIHINKKYHWYVVTLGNSNVKALGNSNVKALGHSHIEALGNSHIEAWENSSIKAKKNSVIEAWENSHVKALENSSVVAKGNSYVMALGHSSIEALGYSHIEAWENSHIKAWENSSVVAWENSIVEARGNSNIEARDNSHIKATANAQVVDRHNKVYGKIQINGNARIVYIPKNINEFMDFYDIKHTKTRAIFYKAVHRTTRKDVFKSDYNPRFKYVVGETKKEKCDIDTTCDCSYGIHISHLDYALDFGSNWNDLAIIECETKISDIVMPENTADKVRTSEIKVLREIPLEECGTYGKILANSKI